MSSYIAIIVGNRLYEQSLTSLTKKRITWFANQYSVKIADRFNHVNHFHKKGLRINLHRHPRPARHLQKHHHLHRHNLVHHHQPQKHPHHHGLCDHCLSNRLPSHQNSREKGHQKLLRLQILLRQSTRGKRPRRQYLQNLQCQGRNHETNRRQVRETSILQISRILHKLRHLHSHRRDQYRVVGQCDLLRN